MKILQVMNYPQTDYLKYRDSGRMDLYHDSLGMCYDYLIEQGHDVMWYVPKCENSFQRFLGKFLHLYPEAIGQLNILRVAKKYDAIYCPLDNRYFIIGIFKALGLIKIPVLCMSHSSFNTTDVSTKAEKLFLKIERHYLYKYFNSIFFASKCFLEIAMMDSKVPARHRNVAHWGGDTDFYYDNKQNPSYYLAIGQAKRDFPTLVAAFERMPDKQLKILARGEAVLKSINRDKLPNNVEIIANDNDIEHWMRMREIYAGAKATLIAITSNHHFACGSTVLVESLAASTPVFISNVSNTFVDVEKERVGKKIGLFDVEGWVSAINDFESHPKIAEEFSKNARKLAEEQYNYKMSCRIIEKELYKITGK